MDHTPRRKVAVLYGTRSEAVQLAPVVGELRRRNTHVPYVVVCARQRGLLDQVNRLFDIVPDHDLDVLRRGYSLDDVLVGAIRGFSEYLDVHPVDAVVVQGGATAAFAGALTAYHRQIPVVHVDAGLLEGDAVLDSLMQAASRPATVSDPVIETAIHERRRLILVTAQWLESWGDEITQVARALVRVADRFPDVLVAVPLDGSPTLHDAIAPAVFRTRNIRLTGPLPYTEIRRMLSRAAVVVTDSGAVHGEAPGFAVPVVVTRDTTERAELLDEDDDGRGGVLVGADTEQITEALSVLLTDRELSRCTVPASGSSRDGDAAERVADLIENLFASRRARPVVHH